MFGLFGLRDWLLGAARGCATILLIFCRIFSGLDLFGTSGKAVGRTDRNSAAAPSQIRLATPLERLTTELPTRPRHSPKATPRRSPSPPAGCFRPEIVVVVASGKLFDWLVRNQPDRILPVLVPEATS